MLRSEIIDLQEDFNIKINDSTITLYHATTKEAAKNIVDTQTMFGKEDGLFFPPFQQEK